MSLLQNSNAISTGGGYDLTDSLRFRKSASAYLNRTPASASNRRTWTWSGWVKRGDLTNTHNLFSVRISAASRTVFRITLDKIDLMDGDTNFRLTTTALFRDPSAWYHIVLVCDTTQATSTDRIKLYVNGEQVTAFSPATYPSLNFQTNINNTLLHAIGREGSTTNDYLDGYMTEVNFVDGQALTPSDFGETDTVTGVWKPKKYTGTYGTNGFYLKGRGTDNSGNGNNWTENNFNTTNSALTTYDIMKDVPTLTDEDTANFATLNPLSSIGVIPTNGNLTIPAYGVNHSTTGTIGVSSGKWYFEVKGNSPYWVAGVTTLSTVPYGISPQVVGSQALAVYTVGYKYNNGTATAYGATYTTNDIMAIALDLDAGTITWYKNGVSQGVAFTGLSGTYFPVLGGPNDWACGDINFGQRPFAYTPPTGFKKLNTYNLPDSSIIDGSQYMNTALWTGDGTSSRSITGVGFEPDLVWWKNRTTARWHQLFDSVRGADKAISSNSTDAEDAAGGYGGEGSVTSFDSDGFTLQGGVGNNESGSGIVGWSWRGSDSTAVSNTDGTITSTVSANPTAGFSVVTYDPTPSGTVGHGLGTAPELIIEKKLDTTGDWLVGTTVIDGSYDYLRLNTNAAKANAGVAAPTATGFTPNLGGDSAVAYCFTSVEGFSKIGTYTGNASTDGPFVYTGFRPAFILVKSTGQVGNWFIMDTTRDPDNVATQRLFSNFANAEDAAGIVDFTANGFKLRMSTALNDATNFIYMAFAENPFKNSLAR